MIRRLCILTVWLVASCSLLAQAPNYQRPWSPLQACGQPNTMRMGDYPSAWASRLPDGGEEWLQLEYPAEIRADEIIIYESFNPGAITKVLSVSANGAETIVWQGRANATNSSVAHAFRIRAPDVPTRALRIYLDTQLVPGWNEIDAVVVRSADGVSHWAVGASASSSYADLLQSTQFAWHMQAPPWSPQQATGAPNTPVLGDLPTAWASREPDAGLEWLLLTFSNAVDVAGVNIRESCAPGAISRVLALSDRGDESVLWEGVQPARAQAGSPVIFTVEPTSKVRARRIKIELDTTRVPDWNEIDAVELVGSDGSRQWASGASASSTFAEFMRGVLRPSPAVNLSVQQLTDRVAELERTLAAAEAATPASASQIPRAKNAAGGRSWFPEQACGAPDTFQMADIPTAWASRDCDGGHEWLELRYSTPAEIAQLQIYETYNPGAITSVVAIVAAEFDELPELATRPRADGLLEVVLWTGTAPLAHPSSTQPHIFVVTPTAAVTTSKIRIYLDTRLVNGWNEIDAVELVGRDGSRQWAAEASASSSFGDHGPVSRAPLSFRAGQPARQNAADMVSDLASHMERLEGRARRFASAPPRMGRPSDPATPRRRMAVNAWNWGPEQACGTADTMQMGDFPTAWAPANPDDGPEWLEVVFERAVDIEEVRIFESCGPGAITRVSAISGLEQILLQPATLGTKNPINTACNTTVFVVTAPRPGIQTKKIRVELDTRRIPGWNEIDAVELLGRDGSRQWAVEAAASTSYAD